MQSWPASRFWQRGQFSSPHSFFCLQEKQRWEARNEFVSLGSGQHLLWWKPHALAVGDADMQPLKRPAWTVHQPAAIRELTHACKPHLQKWHVIPIALSYTLPRPWLEHRICCSCSCMASRSSLPEVLSCPGAAVVWLPLRSA